MGMILYVIVLATAILSLPAVAGKEAKQDLWISPIWASIIGFLVVSILWKLHIFYPKQNIVQYSEHIMGKFAAKILAIIFLFFHLFLNGIVLRQYAEFIANFFPKTPILVVIASLVLVSASVAYGGLEVLARVTQTFFPLFVFPFLIMGFLLLPDMKVQNILPIMGNGILPSLKGAIAVQSWLGDFLYISFFLPFLTNPEKGRKWGIISIVTVVLTMVFTNLITIFVLDGVIKGQIYPVMNVARYISLGQFFEHLESIVMAIWVTGIFLKISAIYYVLVLGAAQCLDVKDYKPFVLKTGIIRIYPLYILS